MVKKEPKYTIYGFRGCPFTEAAIQLSEQRNENYTFIDRSEIPLARQNRLKREGHATWPAIFQKTKFIGGYNEFEKSF